MGRPAPHQSAARTASTEGGSPFTPAAILYRNPEAAVPAPWRGWLWPDCVTGAQRIAVDIVTLLRRFAMHSYNTVRFCGVCHGRAARAVGNQLESTPASAAHSPVWRWPSSLASPSSSISPSRAIFAGVGQGFQHRERGSHAVGAGVVAVLNERHTAFFTICWRIPVVWYVARAAVQRAASTPGGGKQRRRQPARHRRCERLQWEWRHRKCRVLYQ